MKSFILTLTCILIGCSILLGQVKKNGLEFYGYKIGFHKRSLINNKVFDTTCYQVQYVTAEGRILTDTTINCELKTYKMYFPFQYSSNLDSIKADTFEFLDIYDGLQQFNEPIIWNSAELNNSIRIAIFKDTLPEIFRMEFKNDTSKVIKKVGRKGHWFWDIDKGYTEEIRNINQRKINKIKKIITEIINHPNCNYRNSIRGKQILIEMNFNNKYEFIMTDQLILSMMNQNKAFRRVVNLIE